MSWHCLVRRCTAWSIAVWVILFPFGRGAARATTALCLGDCNGDGAVSITELIVGVNIALGTATISACPQFDRNGDSTVSIDEIIAAVQNALNNCQAAATPTQPSGTVPVPPTPTPSARPTVPATPNFMIHGKVSLAAASGGGVSPADSATVSATIDRNGDGQIDAGESTDTSADTEGAYSLALAVSDGERVVVGFRTADAAPLFRTVVAAADSNVMLNVTLRTSEELACEGETCALQGDRFSLEGLPAGVQGTAQVFNPVSQVDAFPGDFTDSNGDLLLSGVFASVELESEQGQPVKQLPSAATLRMQLPRDTWPIVVDIAPGNGRIDVPLYAFDETAGTWVREGSGVLEDADRTVIPESALASIRSGSYAGVVTARGDVSHLSYWNVDWPIESHGCVAGRVLDASGDPVRGATVTARGVTYVGTSPSSVTDDDGRFCIDALRSENPGEDVDQDGIPGETQTISLRVVHDGHIYDGGEIDMPQQAGTCGADCLDIGDVRLTPDRELHPSLCTVNVNVRDKNGVPVANAFVVANDDTVDPDVAYELCYTNPEDLCQPAVSSDENGDATLKVVVLDSLYVGAFSSVAETDSILQTWGEGTFTGCPTQRFPVTLTDGYRQVVLALEFTPPGTIDWTPTTFPVTTLEAVSGISVKWALLATASGFDPPLTYGTVPPGAMQLTPLNNAAPLALSSGDFITVIVDAPGADGYPVIGQGVAFVP